MPFKAYMIVYKVEGTDELLKSAIKSSGTWMSYFNNFYLLYTQLDLASLKTKLDGAIFIGKDRILIAEVDINTVKGWLPKNAWDWLRNQRNKK